MSNECFTKNRPDIQCQYWVEDEPVQCKYWDESNTICRYKEEKVVAGNFITLHAPLYPLCNYIGTARDHCDKYDSGIDDESLIDTEARCVIPDPYRSISKSICKLEYWVDPQELSNDTISGTNDRKLVRPLDYSKINGYNGGKCDGKGTQVTCSGFSPQHMGMGGDAYKYVCSAGESEECISLSEVSFFEKDQQQIKLPLSYKVANMRSKLAPCKWWDKNASTDFTLCIKKEEVIIKAPQFSCTFPYSDTQDYSKFKYINELQYLRPPCNGSFPDCPRYTGNLSTNLGHKPFTGSTQLRYGDKVLAEQIFELRYNIRKERWDKESYNNSFDDPDIYAWTSKSPEVIFNENGEIVDYSIEAVYSFISDFNSFDISYNDILLTKGNPSDNNKIDYPTLISDIKPVYLKPIIRSVFDEIDGSKIFETCDINHKNILIVGDTYYRNNKVFAINISDPELSFPFKEMLNYDSLHDMYADYTKQQKESERFTEFYTKLKAYLDFLQKFYPDKVFYSSFNGVGNNAFYIEVSTYFGENEILVIDDCDGEGIEFDFITITKLYCGGVVAQTEFELITNNSSVYYYHNYEKYPFQSGFSGKIKYKYIPFKLQQGVSSAPVYTYLDGKLEKPSPTGNDSLICTYNTYKILIMKFVLLTNSNFKFLGNNGYILAIIDDREVDDSTGEFTGDNVLHNLIKPWEIDGKIYLKGEDYNCEEVAIELEVYKHCIDSLPVNHVIFRPKNVNDYRRVYNPFILIDKIYIYERYSFGDEPKKGYGYEVIDSDLYSGISIDKRLGELDGNKNLQESYKSGNYTLTELPYAPLISSVVFKSSFTNRILGQVKTELMVWIKNVYCSDIEIKYQWSANYEVYDLLPKGYCFVDEVGREFKGTVIRSYSPYCGDHYFGLFNTRPSWMWYPYDYCDDYASYEINAGSGEYDNAPMEFWLDNKGHWAGSSKHGYFDLRMLGPADNYGETTDTHFKIWACGCDYTHTNYRRYGDIFFSGFARKRTYISAEDMYYVTRNGGIGPRFGNKYRDYMISFRSNMPVYFLKLEDYGLTTDVKWTPYYETFYDISYSVGSYEQPFKNYFNDGDSTFIFYPQLGVCVNNYNELGGKEELIKNSSYRFDEVIIPHISWSTNVTYPKPKHTYTKFSGATLQESSAWYTYSPTTGYVIDNCWLLPWEPIDRFENKIDFYDIKDYSSYSPNNLSFIDISYLNYTYDYACKQLRRTCTEGSHVLSLEPSQKYDVYFLIGLDGSGYRLLDHNFKLVTNPYELDSYDEDLFTTIDNNTIKEWIKSYKYCSSHEWLNEINSTTDLRQLDTSVNFNVISEFIIYDSDIPKFSSEQEAKNDASQNGRIVKYTDGNDEVIRYYNTGLYLRINGNTIDSIPKEVRLVQDNSDMSFSKVAVNDDTQLSTVVPGNSYPSSVVLNAEYDDSENDKLKISFSVEPIILYNIEVKFRVGAEYNEDNKLSKVYVTPNISISTYPSEVSYIEEHNQEITSETYDIRSNFYYFNNFKSDKMFMKVTNINLNIRHKVSYSNSGLEDFVTEEEFNSVKQVFYLEEIRVNELKLLSCSETFNTYERKFMISNNTGYGDKPIHGDMSTGSLLYPSNTEPTLYQIDRFDGVLGWPGSTDKFNTVSKQRGRFCGEIESDKQILEGDLRELELKQSKIYNDVLNYNSTEAVSFKSILHILIGEKLAEVGIDRVPSWVCTLKNKAPLKLEDVKKYNKYNPQGHKWTYDTGPNKLQYRYNCGGEGKGKWKVVFSYIWGRVSGFYGYDYETDGFDLYSYGLLRRVLNGTLFDRD